MISFIKKLTVHAQFLVFNQTWKTYKKNLKEMLISVSIKKNQFRNISVRNLPNPNILIATNQNLQKKNRKRNVEFFFFVFLETFLIPYLPYYQIPVRN